MYASIIPLQDQQSQKSNCADIVTAITVVNKLVMRFRK